MPENALDGPGDEAPKAQRLGHFGCPLTTVPEAWCRGACKARLLLRSVINSLQRKV